MNSVQLYEMSKKVSKPSKRGKYQVVLHNDNHNTFDHVINCLMDVCAHNYIQAVQCAHIVHHSGKCSIFTDVWEECEDVKNELEHLGLKVTVTKYKKHV